MAERQKPLARLMRYMFRYKIRFFGGILLMMVYAGANAGMPVLMGSATDAITLGDLQGLYQIFGLLIITAIVMFFTGSAGQRLVGIVSQQALCDLRNHLFVHIQDLSLNFFDRQPVGELMSRLSNDTDVIDQFFSTGYQQLVQAVLSIIIISIVMLFLSLRLSIISFSIIIVLVLIIYLLGKSSRPVFLKLQEQMSVLNGFAEERIAGQKVVLAYLQEGKSVEEFSRLSKETSDIGERASLIAMVTLPISLSFANFQTVALLIFGGIMVVHDAVPLGLLVSFLGLSRGITAPMAQIFSSYSLLMNAQAGAARVFAVIDEEPVVADLPDAPPMPPIAGEVRFERVHFSYIPGRTVLRDNTFRAVPGQVFGLCGPTGAGKSTIINILTRYYDIEQGSITIDGTGIDNVGQNSLRIQIAQVLQEPFLFSDTILENLRYARRDATDEECIDAARKAGADEFILNLPDGYHTSLTDGGTNLSQGQRQMLTIARAMVAEPRLLILDEATSNVDTRTEKIIQTGLMELQKGKTSFIIAHRLSTIRHSDCILVINQGEIVERGTHDELMEQKGFYHTLFMSQFRGRLSGIS